MNKEKLVQIKNKIKTHIPVIVAVISTAATAAAYIAYQKEKQTPCEHSWSDDFAGGSLLLHEKGRAMIAEDPSQICYKIEDKHYTLASNDDCTKEH